MPLSEIEGIYLWTKVLSNEGRNIAKRAEKAEEAKDYNLAKELYLKAVAKFKNASEISGNMAEVNMLRELSNYYYARALKVDKEISKINKSISGKQSTLQPVKQETSASDVPDLLKGTGIQEPIFKAVLNIAIEIGQEGREGRHIGTAFVIGDTTNVMAKSRQLILNPFEGHSREKRIITDPETQENVKEFAQLDGIFVISTDGVVEAAGRYITIDTGMVKLQKGLGTRHSSVAAITSVTRTIGIVVSQSGGVIRIFRDGKMVSTVKP